MTDYKDILKSIGMNFRIERIKLNLSQEKFAERVGVHTNYIGKIERGEQNLTVKKIVQIADSINIPVDKILNIRKAEK